MNNSTSDNISTATSSLQGHLLTAAKGGSILLAGRLFTHASRLLTAILLARVLAAENYGHYKLGLTSVEVSAGLASLGLHKALVRFIPVFLRRSDRAGLWGTLRFCAGANAALSVLLGIGLFIWADHAAEYIFHDPKVARLLRLMSVFLPFFALNDGIAAATRGFKNFHYTTIAQYVSHPLIKFALLLLLVPIGLTSVRALAVSGISEIAVFAMLLYFLRKQLHAHKTMEEPRREMGAILRYSLPLYLSYILNEFSGRFQILFLGALGTATHVGVYALTREITRVSALFQNSIRTSSEPIISGLFSGGTRKEESRRELIDVYQNLTRWTFALNLPLFLILILLPGPILSLFGGSFTEGAALVWVLAARRLLYVATGMCNVVLDMSGYTLLKLLNSFISVGILIGLNFWLIPLWGAFGAAVAVSVSEGSACLLRLAQVGMLFRTLPYNKRFLKPIAAGLIAVVCSLLLGQWLPPAQSVVYTAANALVILVAYGVGNLMMGLAPEERMLLMQARSRAQALVRRVPAFASSQ